MRATRVIVALLAAGVGAGAAVAAVAADRSSATNITAPGTGTGTAVTGTVVSPAPTTPGGTGSPTAPPAERTYPRVRPNVGGAHTSFTLWFTLREAPGHAGVLATDYRVQVSPPSHATASCWPAQHPPVQAGRKGETVRLRLPTPSAGWCVARYTVTVYLERGPYCPPPVAGKPPTPCPEFATQELDVGKAHFTAR
jgi:hypothetical protein